MSVRARRLGCMMFDGLWLWTVLRSCDDFKLKALRKYNVKFFTL